MTIVGGDYVVVNLILVDKGEEIIKGGRMKIFLS